MKSKSLAYLSAAALGAAITIATPAMAFHGGGGFGGGRMHSYYAFNRHPSLPRLIKVLSACTLI
jgi:hypothetical protein